MSLSTLLLKKGERKMLKISLWDSADNIHCVLCSRVQVLPSPSCSETNIFMVKQLVSFKACCSWGMRYKKQMPSYTWENESMDRTHGVPWRWVWGRKSCPNTQLEMLQPEGLTALCNIPEPLESPPAALPQAWDKVSDIGQSESRFLEEWVANTDIFQKAQSRPCCDQM